MRTSPSCRNFPLLLINVEGSLLRRGSHEKKEIRGLCGGERCGRQVFPLVLVIVCLIKFIRELKHRRFWATDGNRKATVIGFGVLSITQKKLVSPRLSVYKLMFTDKKSIPRAKEEKIRLSVAVRGSLVSVIISAFSSTERNAVTSLRLIRFTSLAIVC